MLLKYHGRKVVSMKEEQDWQGQVWFLAATIDDPSIAAPTGHVYVSHQQPWVKLDDGLPVFQEF